MKWPKYIVMPVALLVYFVAMAVYGVVHNEGKLPEDFFMICGIELCILVALFFLLRYRDRKRREQ